MQARKDKVVRGLTGGVESLFRKNKVTRVTGVARLRSANQVEVAGESKTVLETRRVLIATGSKPTALPGIAYDGRRIVHSTDALTLSEVPRRLVVVGAGAIGLELGSVWRRLGSEVHVLEFLDRPLAGMDYASTALLHRALEKQGLTFAFGATARAARVEGDQVHVTVAVGGEERVETADVLLVAGRPSPLHGRVGREGAGRRDRRPRPRRRGRELPDQRARNLRDRRRHRRADARAQGRGRGDRRRRGHGREPWTRRLRLHPQRRLHLARARERGARRARGARAGAARSTSASSRSSPTPARAPWKNATDRSS